MRLALLALFSLTISASSLREFSPAGRRVNPAQLAARNPSLAQLHLIVELPLHPSLQARAQLASQGITLHAWLDSTRYLATLSRRALAASSLPTFELLPADKLSAYLPSASWAAAELNSQPALDVSVLLFPDSPLDDAAALARSHGWAVLAQSDWQHRLTLRLPRTQLHTLAALDPVRHVQPIPPPYATSDNAWSAALLEADKVSTDTGVKGHGVNVGIWDGGTVSPHSDFSGRLTFLETPYRAAHATHVAATLAGDGYSDPALRGLAPAAQLYSGTFYDDYDTRDDVFSKMKMATSRFSLQISHNSWGASIGDSYGNCEMFGDYIQEENIVDQMTIDLGLNFVFSMGNPRDSGQCALSARGGFYSAGIPASAKNAIAVAAVDRESAVSTFSGFGPTRDGRLKPDVSALGVNVRSLTTTVPTSASGTSMSAPAVSGFLALMIERLSRQPSLTVPKPALLKAILLNTARDTGNPGPDYVFGYGIPNAPSAFKSIDEKLFLSANLSTPDASHTITVPPGAAALRLMLAWTDPAGQPESPTSLVNDLDLSLKSPSGSSTLPLTLDPRKPSANAVPAINRRDNAEQIVIQNPEPGDYTASVNAFRLASGSQDYVLTWSFDPVPTPACSITLDKSTITAPETGGSLPVAVTLANQCPPAQIENPADWVAPNTTEPITTSSTVKMRLSPNQSDRSRSTMLLIGGRQLRINQSGPCLVQPLPESLQYNERLSFLDCLYYGSHAKLVTFEAKAGQTVSIELRSQDFDAYLELLGPNLEYITYDDDSIGASDARIPGPEGKLTLPSSGTYTIVVTSYALREGAFNLKVEFGGPNDAPPPDANPRPIKGCPFQLETTLSESASPNGRRGSLYYTDAYTVQAFAGQRLDLSVTNAAFDSFIYLISPVGEILASNDDDPASPSASRITQTLPIGGQWRIEVTSFSPFTTGPYKLNLHGCPTTPQ